MLIVWIYLKSFINFIFSIDKAKTEWLHRKVNKKSYFLVLLFLSEVIIFD